MIEHQCPYPPIDEEMFDRFINLGIWDPVISAVRPFTEPERSKLWEILNPKNTKEVDCTDATLPE